MKLNNFQIKLIAIVLMTIAHIQYHIGVNPILYIGQASFPIFVYLCAYAYDYTSNINKYLMRILGYGVLLQIPLILLHINYINIFITLGLGLLAIHAIKTLQAYLLIPIFIFAYVTNLDYGTFGILLMLTAYYFRHNVWLFGIALISLQFIYITILHEFMIYQWLSIIAIPILALYNGKRGKYSLKWFFYLYYPIHVSIIYVISLSI